MRIIDHICLNNNLISNVICIMVDHFVDNDILDTVLIKKYIFFQNYTILNIATIIQ